jgi:hypothetical protein
MNNTRSAGCQRSVIRIEMVPDQELRARLVSIETRFLVLAAERRPGANRKARCQKMAENRYFLNLPRQAGGRARRSERRNCGIE